MAAEQLTDCDASTQQSKTYTGRNGPSLSHRGPKTSARLSLGGGGGGGG